MRRAWPVSSCGTLSQTRARGFQKTKKTFKDSTQHSSSIVDARADSVCFVAMGCMQSTPSSSGRPSGGGSAADKKVLQFAAIQDRFTTLEQVQKGLREAGLESSNLIIGVDFTKSNTWTGKNTFGGKCLHALEPGQMNPYQRVIDVVARTLEVFDDDKVSTLAQGENVMTVVDVLHFFFNFPAHTHR
jgi:hypothetical protein